MPRGKIEVALRAVARRWTHAVAAPDNLSAFFLAKLSGRCLAIHCAPISLVFAGFQKKSHLRQWVAPQAGMLQGRNQDAAGGS